MENDSRGSREHETVGESYKDIVETGWINSNSRGSREHKTEGIGETCGRNYKRCSYRSTMVCYYLRNHVHGNKPITLGCVRNFAHFSLRFIYHLRQFKHLLVWFDE